MNNVFLYRMPLGIAGAVSRLRDLTVEPAILDADNMFPAYGLAGKYNGENFVPLAEGDTADVIKGFLIRPWPTTANPDLVRQVGTGHRWSGDILKRGYMTVNVGGDASMVTKGGAVWVRVSNPTDDSPLGAILAAEDGTSAVIVPDAEFTGAGDADGNVEISYKI
ncbi:hypothetical protein ACH7OW_004453 [Escherichia coli]|uniref:structural cement protein Gp24 n=1 Tax=Escherichia sp. 20412-1 TaxID=2137853 RepID=UPI000D17C4FC|nr:hypothetical protein [Escherichia sp. 20412-1]PSY61249.1 hypothetical protein C7B16_21320 [Escherichia sp. 20412-1]